MIYCLLIYIIYISNYIDSDFKQNENNVCLKLLKSILSRVQTKLNFFFFLINIIDTNQLNNNYNFIECVFLFL